MSEAFVKNNDPIMFGWGGEDESKNRWITFGCVLALIAVIGIGSFSLGRAAEARRFQEEKNLDILLSRSDLEGLGEIEGTIYVTGHKSPDSFRSAVSMPMTKKPRRIWLNA